MRAGQVPPALPTLSGVSQAIDDGFSLPYDAF